MLNFSTGVIAQQVYNYFILSIPSGVVSDPLWLIEDGNYRPQVREISIISNIRALDVHLYVEGFDPEVDDPEESQVWLDAYGVSIDKTSGSYDFTITATFTEPKDTQGNFNAEIVITSPYLKESFVIPVVLKSSWTPGGTPPASEPYLIVQPRVISVYNQAQSETLTIQTNTGTPTVSIVLPGGAFVSIGTPVQDPNNDEKYTCYISIAANNGSDARMCTLRVTAGSLTEDIVVVQTATSSSPGGGGSGGSYEFCVSQCNYTSGISTCLQQCLTYYGQSVAIE